MKIIIYENFNCAFDLDDVENTFRFDSRNPNNLDILVFTSGLCLNGEDNYVEYKNYNMYMKDIFSEFLKNEFIKILHISGIPMIRNIYHCILQRYNFKEEFVIDSYECMMASDINIRDIELYGYKLHRGCARETCDIISIFKTVLEEIINFNQDVNYVHP